MPSIRSILHSQRGAADLASVMVGVIVTGILSTMVVGLVTQSALLSQTENTARDLRAFASVQQAAAAAEGKYLTVDELVDGHYIGSEPTVSVVLPANGSCYVAAAEAPNGTVYYLTSESGRVHRAGARAAEVTAWCAAFPAVR